MIKSKISDNISAALNLQMTQESYASTMFCFYTRWAKKQGWLNIAKYFQSQGETSQQRMMRLKDYILQKGISVSIKDITINQQALETLSDCFEQIVKLERKNKEKSHKVFTICLEEVDAETMEFNNSLAR